eukprot:Seg1946.10 transcript_id=Seg1946.10/GoldUCD/mRNA.D3Y31 product="hypothetical protein" protein_id=Seg1946.10/GoldUCD/D3Y31
MNLYSFYALFLNEHKRIVSLDVCCNPHQIFAGKQIVWFLLCFHVDPTEHSFVILDPLRTGTKHENHGPSQKFPRPQFRCHSRMRCKGEH